MGDLRFEGQKLQIGLYTLLVFSIILLARDRFALNIIGRLTFSEVFFAAFIFVSFLFSEKIELSVSSSIVILSVLGFGIIGIVSSFYLSLQGTLPDPGWAFIDSSRYLLFATTIFFSVSFIKDSSVWEHFIYILIISYCFVMIVSFGQIFAVQGIAPFDQWFAWENIRGGGHRIAGTFRWQGPLVLFVALMLPILICLASIREGSQKYKYILLIIMGLIVMGFTGSRSALLVLPFSLLPVALAAARNHRTTSIISVSIVGFSFAGILFFLLAFLEVQAVERMINRMIEAVLNPTEEKRFEIWVSSLLTMLDTSLLFGLGPRQTAAYIGASPHNSFVGMVVERGIVGGATLVVFSAYLLREAIQLMLGYLHGGPMILASVGCLVPVLFVYSITGSGFAHRLMPLTVALILATHEMYFES